MTTPSRKGPIVDPGMCRCCGVAKKCRLLNVEYEWCGHKEVYSDMFFDCFGLLLSQLDGEPEERVICATCVSRLRDATAFRRQVLQCEQHLLQATIHIHNEDGEKSDVKNETDLKAALDDGNAVVSAEHGEHERSNEEDMMDNDADSVKSELIKHEKKVMKRKKKTAKVKLSKKKKRNKAVVNGECEKGSRRLRSEKSEKDVAVKPPPKPKLDNEHKSFRNTVTIVENSFVCPFDASFSDYYCVYCRNVFTDPDKLREHTSTHDPGSFKDVVSNKKLLQIDTFRIDCRLCPKGIDSVDVLKNHLASEHGKLVYSVTNEFLKYRLTLTNLCCTECGASFSFFHALKKHMAEHFGQCICDVCGAHYFEERMLVLHQKSHQKTEETFPCHCGKAFKSKHSQYLHEARIHKKEPAYQCNKCDEVLFSYSLRYRHMMEVHGEQRLFPCDNCERAYVSRKSLREHNRRFHLKIFKHQCDLCDKRFYLPSRLKEHMATHTGERNFRCEYCGKSYPRLRGLKVHMQSHSTEKKYRCLVCNASFTQNVNLKNHMKRQHQNLDMEDGFHE